jgi:hypothetical protein
MIGTVAFVDAEGIDRTLDFIESREVLTQTTCAKPPCASSCVSSQAPMGVPCFGSCTLLNLNERIFKLRREDRCFVAVKSRHGSASLSHHQTPRTSAQGPFAA